MSVKEEQSPDTGAAEDLEVKEQSLTENPPLMDEQSGIHSYKHLAIDKDMIEPTRLSRTSVAESSEILLKHEEITEVNTSQRTDKLVENHPSPIPIQQKPAGLSQQNLQSAKLTQSERVMNILVADFQKGEF